MIRNILLTCGIISSLYYILINIIVAMQYPGYSAVSQTVSELSAIGSPTRPLWSWLCSFYSLFIIAFGGGIWISVGRNRRVKTVAALMLIYGVSGFFWPPMHQREVLAAGGETMTDTMHIAFTIATIVLMLLMIALGAATFGKRFRYYSVGTISALVLFGCLTAVDAPKINANLPTPLIGVWERINIGVFLLWVMMFAIILLRKEKRESERKLPVTNVNVLID